MVDAGDVLVGRASLVVHVRGRGEPVPGHREGEVSAMWEGFEIAVVGLAVLVLLIGGVYMALVYLDGDD